MKDFIKTFFINFIYFILFNCIIFLGHVWALFGVAFNDSGVQYNTVLKAIPIILLGIAPILIASLIFIFIFKKKKSFSIYIFLILQSLVILGWILFYVICYVPNSKINKYYESKVHHNKINKQNAINQKVLNELDNYSLIDSISDKEQSVSLYFNENNKKLIIEHTINNEKNYNIINSFKKESIEKLRITKNDSDYYFKFDENDNLSLCNVSECYYTYSNVNIDNSYEYLTIYNSNGKRYYPIEIYKTLVKNSVSNNDNVYYLNDDRRINIELYNNIIRISDESKKYVNNKNYTWVILRNDEIFLQRAFNDYELILNKDFFNDEQNNYECYLKTYNDELGYIKISNSLYWPDLNN